MKKLFLSFLIPAIIAGGIFLSCTKKNHAKDAKKNNKPPIAIAGPDQVITLPTDSISLDGSASNDPAGTISDPIPIAIGTIGRLWKKIEGPASFNIVSAATENTLNSFPAEPAGINMITPFRS